MKESWHKKIPREYKDEIKKAAIIALAVRKFIMILGNEKRPHMALGGKTPKEYLMEKLKNHISKQALVTPIKSVQRVG